MRSEVHFGCFALSMKSSKLCNLMGFFSLLTVTLKALDITEAHYLHLHYKHYSCCPRHSGELSGDIKLSTAQQKVRSSASELSQKARLSSATGL